MVNYDTHFEESHEVTHKNTGCVPVLAVKVYQSLNQDMGLAEFRDMVTRKKNNVFDKGENVILQINEATGNDFQIVLERHRHPGREYMIISDMEMIHGKIERMFEDEDMFLVDDFDRSIVLTQKMDPSEQENHIF